MSVNYKNKKFIDNLVESFLEFHQKHMIIINGRTLKFLNLRYIFKWLTDRYILIKKSDCYEEILKLATSVNLSKYKELAFRNDLTDDEKELRLKLRMTLRVGIINIDLDEAQRREFEEIEKQRKAK